MIKKFPIHPLVFGLYPALFLTYHSLDQLHPDTALRTGSLWLLGAAAVYAVGWFVLRSTQRAAVVASLALMFVFAYDPAYELVRGFAFGRHRFLAPLWVILLGLAALAVLRFKPGRSANRVLNLASLALLVPLLVAVVISGAWAPPLRVLGVLPPPRVEVTFIDIGKRAEGLSGEVGDAILLRTSEGKTALIDAGFPNQMTSNYLIQHGVTHLDLVVLTHPHDDHAGGLIDVLQAVPVDLMVTNGESLDSPIYQELEAVMERTGVQVQVVRGGDELAFGSLVFDVLSPVHISVDNVNLNSVVLRLKVGEVAFLFTGDTEYPEELRLAESGIDLRANILKLAHHGSESSSAPAFVEKVAPDIAIYSIGPGNDFLWPHPNTLNTMKRFGVEVYGTDTYGTIIVNTDGKTYEVVTETGGAD